MKREIIFSKIAKEKLVDLLEYLQYRWSKKTKEDFIIKLDKCLYIIQDDPGVFPASEINKNRRRCVVTKQTTIFYTFTSKTIRITALFDTRQDPNKIKKDLE